MWAAGSMPGNASPNDVESNQSSWGVGANITTKLINQSGEVRNSFLVTAAEKPNVLSQNCLSHCSLIGDISQSSSGRVSDS